MYDISSEGFKREVWRMVVNALCVVVYVGAIMCAAYSVVWALDDEERLINEGKQDECTAILPVVNR